MRLTVLVLCLVAGTLGYLINVPTAPATQRVAQLDWIRRQKVITLLFQNFCEDSNDDFIIRSAQDFLTHAAADFNDPDVFTRFKTLIESGVLAKGIIFTEYNKEHFKEFEVIRDVLYYAKDFEVFFKAAAWARQTLNCGVFIDVFYSALIYRKDTEKLSLPAPYELLPNYFFKRDDIITGASLMSGITTTADNVRDDGNTYVITSKYTTEMTEESFEDKLAYFNEDIGLNTYIFLNKLIGKESWNLNSYGEYLYHFMKQLITRYNLERYSNALPELKSINWDMPIVETYDSMLIYSNGNDFDFRTKAFNGGTMDYIIFLKNIEANIDSMVTRMMQNGFDKTAILNNLIDILVTGENSYENVAFMNLGKDVDSAKMSPSVLEHYMTMARDPMFWLINKRMVDIIDNAISILPSYTRNELYFPGVEVINIEMKALTTSFNIFDTDVTEALKSPSSTGTFLVKMSQQRLSHAPFSMKLNISSVTAQRGFVKIFLGPKMLPGQMASSKNEFMLLDSFEINLKKGGNAITRTSADMKMYTNDFFSMKTLFKKIEDAEFGLNTLSFNEEKMLNGFPSRLLIPKGSVEGLPFQMFVFVAPLTKVSMTHTAATNDFNTAVLSPGYPLDLNVANSQLFDLPNALVKDVIIKHKDSSKGPSNGNGGGYKKPYNGQTQDYLPQPWEQKQYGTQMYAAADSSKTNYNKGGKSGRPEFTLKSKFDGQGSKKYDYKSKNSDKVMNEPVFTNTIDQWIDSVPVTTKTTEDSYFIDISKIDTTRFDSTMKQDSTTEIFLIDPVVYKEDIIKRPFILRKSSSFKDMNKLAVKPLDTLVDSSVDVIKKIDKGIKHTEDFILNMDKNVDSLINKKVKEIDIDSTGNSVVKNIDKGINNMNDFTKTINKNIDSTLNKKVKGVDVNGEVNNVDKVVKKTEDFTKTIDKNVDSSFNNKVKEIDITKDRSINTSTGMDKNVDDGTVHKVIYVYDVDDQVAEVKTTTVATNTIDDEFVDHIFGFDTMSKLLLKKPLSVYDYVVRKPDIDEDEDEKVYE